MAPELVCGSFIVYLHTESLCNSHVIFKYVIFMSVFRYGLVTITLLTILLNIEITPERHLIKILIEIKYPCRI